MSVQQYTAYWASDLTGGALNPAVTNFFFEETRGGDDDNAADILAFGCYMGMGGEAYCLGISVGAATGGGQLPVPFPVAKYEALRVLDPANLKVLVAYGDTVGDNQPLAVAGTGAVIRKQTGTPGRHGRGRMTTPYLKAAGVTDSGRLSDAQKLAIYSGYNQYIMAVGQPTKEDKNILFNVVPAGQIILSFSITDTLGRVRSRRK